MAEGTEKREPLLANCLGKSLYKFDARETRDLLKLFDIKRSKLVKRKEQFNEPVDENVPNETGDNERNLGEENDGHP
ncbi:hypothetical protein FXO38_04203 [Capsicum annuum]|uniref:Uncharacterized protein n=1 Tax=Capsicum annuum TaxID=4072 RepID=A0A2G2Z832_CAPAN|nr:hypothetical protein FXO37_18924 [Capsicum annuum]KAF3676642.1 hypothetical protein FXO38_04203 [Capsicum annuum]PHT78061.1 hypothetical protein T459_16113 [Capsicum annuum]